MNDYPTQIADFLEETATKIRSLTVDRLAEAAKWTGVGIVAVALGLVLCIFLVVGLVRLLAGLVGMQWAYTIIGGLFVIAGMFVWRMRIPRKTTEN
ncbi:MAG: hypothetical protein QNJ75_01585 [Acidimicrobiia bacterium]|nr:hypothetical protein [Acidimicrobiia bacterium]